MRCKSSCYRARHGMPCVKWISIYSNEKKSLLARVVQVYMGIAAKSGTMVCWNSAAMSRSDGVRLDRPQIAGFPYYIIRSPRACTLKSGCPFVAEEIWCFETSRTTGRLYHAWPACSRCRTFCLEGTCCLFYVLYFVVVVYFSHDFDEAWYQSWSSPVVWESVADAWYTMRVVVATHLLYGTDCSIKCPE